MANFDDMSFEKFKLWSEKGLRSFLSLRNKSTDGEFDELAARAFIAWEEKVPVNLDAENAERRLLSEYKNKLILDKIVLPDPLALTTGWVQQEDAYKLWPPVYLTDITNYLQLNCPQELVKQVLNEYKLGKAYRYFSCGWTKEVLFNSVRPSSPVCLFSAKVMPSMNLSCPAYNVWVAVEKGTADTPGGKIMSAYCNCTAGMHGTCNHIASVLFKVEHITMTGPQTMPTTSLPCQWNVPKGGAKFPPIPVHTVNWKKDHYNCRSASANSHSDKSAFTPCNDDQLSLLSNKTNIREKLCKIATICAPESRFRSLLLSHRSPSTVGVTHNASKCPQTIIQLSHSYQDINKFTSELKFTTDMAKALHDSTTAQNLSPVWEEQRKGRITASNFHRVQSRAKTIESNPSADTTSLISTIMGYKKINPTAAMKHGTSCEPHAKKMYIDNMKKSHTKFTASDSGICVILDKPYISASIDLDIKCECCGAGICEIKCPASIKGQKPTLENVSFIQSTNGQLSVKKSHQYYSQIQGQMGVLNRSYCDMFIFTFHGSLTVRQSFDQSYWESMLKYLDSFWKTVIAPEIFTGDVKLKLDTCNSQSQDPTCTGGTINSITSPAKRGHGPDLPQVDQRLVKKRRFHTDLNLCCICGVVCSDKPESFQEESVQCSKCSMWCHFPCGKVTRQTLPTENEDWVCPKCSMT